MTRNLKFKPNQDSQGRGPVHTPPPFFVKAMVLADQMVYTHVNGFDESTDIKSRRRLAYTCIGAGTVIAPLAFLNNTAQFTLGSAFSVVLGATAAFLVRSFSKVFEKLQVAANPEMLNKQVETGIATRILAAGFTLFNAFDFALTQNTVSLKQGAFALMATLAFYLVTPRLVPGPKPEDGARRE
jgi:hypothetical protein